MVETDFSGDYLNAENTKQGDIVTIIEEGSYVIFERDGKSKKVLNIPVEINLKKKIYSPSMDTGKRFTKAWGNDSKEWINKKFTIFHVSYKAYGQVKTAIEGTPIVEEKA